MLEELFSKGGLSLDRLRSFLALAQAGGIARAAPDDPTRQSLMSRQIKELEEFFGAELTRRRGKTLALSPAGERLAMLVRRQLQDLDDFRREQESQPKVFTVSAGASTLEWLVTPRLPEIAAALGGAVLRTELRRSRPLVEGVREGRIDLAVVRRDAIPDASSRNCKAILKLTFHLCIPRTLIGKRAAGDFADSKHWRDLPFAAGRDGGQMDQAVREGMEKEGVEFRPRFECGSMLQVRQLVRQGVCAAVLPGLALRGLDHRDLIILPFAPLAGYGRQLALHWNPRQMQRRGVELAQLRKVAVALAA
jgi:DNA-binding transcriptional LysR family regulator